MYSQQWREAAKPISWDLAAVLAEYGTLRFDPRDVPSQPDPQLRRGPRHLLAGRNRGVVR